MCVSLSLVQKAAFSLPPFLPITYVTYANTADMDLPLELKQLSLVSLLSRQRRYNCQKPFHRTSTRIFDNFFKKF